MGNRGKELAPEVVECLVNLKKHFDRERKTGKTVSTKDPAARTAVGLGLGVATVKRVMAEIKKNKEIPVRHSKKNRGRPDHRIEKTLQPVVREYIRSKNLEGQRATLKQLCNHLLEYNHVDIPTATLSRTLIRWGFTYGEGRRRCALKEREYVVIARRNYLRIKMSNVNKDGTLKRPEVYLDETYVNKNHSSRFTWYLDEDGPWVNKPSGVGPRLIILNAITDQGWVNGARLVFEAKRRTGDYHGQMNWDNFSKWFESQLIPNIPENSIIILDNAGYHNVLKEKTFPSAVTSKTRMQEWLTRNGFPWRDDMLKAELYELCLRLAPKPEFMLDELAERYGHSILRTPAYHPELQPIETCWAIVKNDIAENCDFTMNGLRNRIPIAFSKVTENTCKGIISKVKKQEKKYWEEDVELDEIYDKDKNEELIADKCDSFGVDVLFQET